MTTIITGDSSGLGLALTEELLDRYETVIGVSRKPNVTHPDFLNTFQHHSLDLTDETQRAPFIDSVSQNSSIDTLINCAGMASMNHIFFTPDYVVKNIFELNVLAPFALIRDVGKIMARRRYGRIINISSVATALAIEGEAAYTASKAALEMLTRVAAKEFAPFGITVNAIAPGPMKLGLASSVPPGKIKAIVSRMATKRETTKEDVLSALDFFLDPSNSAVTGTTIYLGGV